MEDCNAETSNERDTGCSSAGSSCYACESNASAICDSNIENDDKRQKGSYNKEPNGVERTFRTNVFAYGESISVIVTSEAAVAQQWLESQNGKRYGMDIEWRPNKYVGQENKVALLQICAKTECLILQMLSLDFIPPGLINFLLDVEQKIAGVGIHADAKKLLRDYGLHCKGLVDLTVLARQRLGKPNCRKMGLKSLAKEVMGLVIEKPKRITMSDWAKQVLDRDQIEYASADAWISYSIYETLMSSPQWLAVPKKS